MAETNPTIQEWKRRYEHQIIEDSAVQRWSVLTKIRHRRGTRMRDGAPKGTAPPKSRARRDR